MSALRKRNDETQTEFAIRVIKAEAWDEGYVAGNDDHYYDADTSNPYRVSS